MSDTTTPAPVASMRLQVRLPTGMLLDANVVYLTAEAPYGHFGVLPRHVDFVAELVPGLLGFRRTEAPAAAPLEFIAVEEGVLVKCGQQVDVAVRHAVAGADLGALRVLIDEQFRQLDEREKATRSAMSRLEANLIRRYLATGRRL